MVKYNFSIEDLNKAVVKSAIKAEAIKLFESEQARRHYNGRERTLSEIVETVRPSKICEEYLIQKQNFKDNPNKWHDVIDENGNPVEVKVIKNDITNYEAYAKGIYNKIKHYNFCKYIYLFKEIEKNKFELVYIYDTK